MRDSMLLYGQRDSGLVPGARPQTQQWCGGQCTPDLGATRPQKGTRCPAEESWEGRGPEQLQPPPVCAGAAAHPGPLFLPWDPSQVSRPPHSYAHRAGTPRPGPDPQVLGLPGLGSATPRAFPIH